MGRGNDTRDLRREAHGEAALVRRNGSIDWCCFPRLHSGACFAALLGGPEHGRWLLAPSASILSPKPHRTNWLTPDSRQSGDSG